MNQNSKSNNHEDRFRDLMQALLSDVSDGKTLVSKSRDILKRYVKCGFSLDDDEIVNILAIESETDTINVASHYGDAEFERIYEIYKAPFEESRDLVIGKVASSRNGI